MRLSAISLTCLVVLLSTLPGYSAAQAVSCEDLRERIEAKIRGNGVENFKAEVVEATGQFQGKVVGTCERGAKRIIYFKEPASSQSPVLVPSSSTAESTAPVKPKVSSVITECADGRVITNGDCKAP